MKLNIHMAAIACIVTLWAAVPAQAAPIYLNYSNISVELGDSMAAEPFANRNTADSLASVIDAETAASGELHLQSTHVWVSGGHLELDFDLGNEYDLTTFHFWNYHSEGFDVDDIDLTFYDASMNLVGTLLDITPALGNGTGSDSDPIFAEDFALSFPSNVRYVNAMLTGSNNQVDFNNIGFTGELSAIPEPSTLALMLVGASVFAAAGYRRRKA